MESHPAHEIAPAGHAIVTGAAGFIGAACVREFLSRGWTVTAVVHRSPPDRLRDVQSCPGLSLVRGSILESGPLVRVLRERIGRLAGRGAEARGAEALVHCAARATDVGWDGKFRKANLVGVENICHAVDELDIGRLVHFSTTDVYGVRDFATADEETPHDNRRNPYPRYKILAERCIRDLLPPERYTILRPGLVWGPGDASVMPRAVAFLRAFPVVVHFGRHRGRNHWPLAYVGNVARVAYAAAAWPQSAGQAYNVVDPEPTTMDEYYAMLIDLFLGERRMPRVAVPFWIGWPAAALSTSLSTLLDREHPLFDPSLYALHHVSHDQRFDGSRARELIRSCGLAWIGRAEAMEEMRKASGIMKR